MRNVVIIKIRDKNGDVVAVDEIALPGDTADGMTATITTIKVRPRPHKDAGRSPLHPNALTLTDLRVGMKIRVNHKDNPSWSYSAIVVGSPTTNEHDITVVPLVRLGDEFDYVMGYPEDMGLMRYVDGSRTWNRYWYTVTAE